MASGRTILLCIDSLGPGGAQRQLCMLAVLLKQHGYDVLVVIYHDIVFFRYLLDNAAIPLLQIQASNRFDRLVQLHRLIAIHTPAVIIAFLENPSLLAELVRLYNRRQTRLIVSERNDMLQQRPFRHRLRLQFHRLTDAVVTNSAELSRSVLQLAPWLASRLHTIPNCVDLDGFIPADAVSENPPGKMLIVARFAEQKNPVRFLETLERLRRQQLTSELMVHWYGNNFFSDGRPTKFSECYLQVRSLIEEKSLHDMIELHEPLDQVAGLYPRYEVFCLPSLYEGCSNVIAEAMACGLPILASRIAANDWLVEEGVNGFLFDPRSPQEMADTIKRYFALSHEQKMQMGQASRRRAEYLLAPAGMAEHYIDLIEQLTAC